ncbi:MAG: nicotinamidase [Nitrospirota bacterium]|jgi:nicotinamidase/pyrazinamidase
MSHQFDPELSPQAGDALLVVDVQNDFLPGGSLAVPHGDEVIDPLNDYIEVFHRRGLPIFASRDWHPADHVSFAAQGGPWPPHCVAGTEGAEFPASLRLPAEAEVIPKATQVDSDAYSAFQGTGLAEELHSREIVRLFVGGLATDYCVRATAEDAISAGFGVALLSDAVRAVNVRPHDGEEALRAMEEEGAILVDNGVTR